MNASRNAAPGEPIVVTGGTGTLGRQVVTRLLGAGRRVRAVSRTVPDDWDVAGKGADFAVADLGSGTGLETALAGASTVVHIAGTAKGDDDKARHLVEAAARVGTRHIVYISVVGADVVPQKGRLDRAMFGYFGAKHAAEQIIAASGIGSTILRATQFHDLTFQTVQGMARMPIIPVPSGFQFQPIDSGEVAEKLVELALGEPVGMLPPMGGPRVYPMADLVRSYLSATGSRRLLVPLRMPGAAAAAFRGGANLAPEHAVGQRTWEEFLAEKLERSSRERIPIAS